MKKSMKVLVVGAGSMGRRRLRDLRGLGVEEIFLFETQADRCSEIAQRFGVRGFTDLDQALDENPEIMVVSTPPALHDFYVTRAMERKLHVFSEVPFAFDLTVLRSIAAASKNYPSVLGVSHTIRYYPPFRIIHDLIRGGRIGKPLYLEFSLGNYLPDWHPYEDYRKFYASDARQGGAGSDMLIHELSAIQWWMGKVVSVYSRFCKLSQLEIKGVDSQDVLLAFESGSRGFFHHDLIEQGSVGRHIRIAGEEGTIEWHQNMPEIRLFNGKNKMNEMLPFTAAEDWPEALESSREMAGILAKSTSQSGRVPSAQSATQYNYESMYLREMRHFLGAVEGKHPFIVTSVDEELQNVRTFHATLRSAESHREIQLNEVN